MQKTNASNLGTWRCQNLLDLIRGPLTGSKIKKLLVEHLEGVKQNTPPESIHALNLEALKAPDITFWSAWDAKELLGCAALKKLDKNHAELKSMRTASAHLRKGVAKQLLNHVLTFAIKEAYQSISLETGAGDEFKPARQLYKNAGFVYCVPFADYSEDPNSVFMTRNLVRGKTND